MGELHSEITRDLRAFIDRQHLFFVATAPSGPAGHVNLSPKGLDALRMLGPREVAYRDAVGSGEVIEPQDAAFTLLQPAFGDELPGTRAIIRVRIHRIADTCGFGVPLMEFRAQRPQLSAWAGRKGPHALRDYQRQNNAASIDGLPALRWTEGE